MAIINRLRLLKPLIEEEITDYKPKVFNGLEINQTKEMLSKFPLKEQTNLYDWDFRKANGIKPIRLKNGRIVRFHRSNN